MKENNEQRYSIQALAELTNSMLIENNSDKYITKVSTLRSADKNSIAVLHNPKYIDDLKKSKANTVIISKRYSHQVPKRQNILLNDNPYKVYALIAQEIYKSIREKEFISKDACIGKNVFIGDGCVVKAGVSIGENVKVGKNTTIEENTVLGPDTVIGDNCHIYNNVSIENTIMGSDVIVYPGARIGKDGFGFASDSDGHYKIPHIGGVLIGDDVEIGANTCIDRGVLEDTVIEEKCRIDNLVQIGHNVVIGRGSVIVAQTGISGSTKLGEFVTLAGQSGIIGHLNIGSHATVLGKSMVSKDIPKNTKVIGYPAIPIKDYNRKRMKLKKILLDL